jgi:hypothetical protein
MVLFWNRLVNMNRERIAKKLFRYDFTLCKGNWCSEIKTLFHSIELGYVYENMSTCDVTSFSEKRFKIHEEKWKFGLTTKPKLRTYITFKDIFITEDYVQYCNS